MTRGLRCLEESGPAIEVLCDECETTLNFEDAEEAIRKKCC